MAEEKFTVLAVRFAVAFAVRVIAVVFVDENFLFLYFLIFHDRWMTTSKKKKN